MKQFLLLSVLVLMVCSGPKVCFASHCVMRGFCGENDYGKATCSYNGSAVALEDEDALKILKEICPGVMRESNLLCCDAEQIVQLRDNLEISGTFGLARCPSCFTNFRKQFCQLTCSPRQSDFMKVTALAFSDEGDLVIDRMSYYMTHRYANGMFDSCKNIQGITPGSTVLDLLCNGWGKECNAERWLNHIGSTPQNNGYSVFEINYHLTSENQVIVNGEKYFPMNESTILCSESPYPGAEACTCLDCELACQFDITTPPLLPEEEKPFEIKDIGRLLPAKEKNSRNPIKIKPLPAREHPREATPPDVTGLLPLVAPTSALSIKPAMTTDSLDALIYRLEKIESLLQNIQLLSKSLNLNDLNCLGSIFNSLPMQSSTSSSAENSAASLAVSNP